MPNMNWFSYQLPFTEKKKKYSVEKISTNLRICVEVIPPSMVFFAKASSPKHIKERFGCFPQQPLIAPWKNDPQCK